MTEFQKLLNISHRYNFDISQIENDSTFINNPEECIRKYVRMAVKPIPQFELNQIVKSGQKVITIIKNHFQDILLTFQGSVMTDTLIPGSSDLDLLVIYNKTSSNLASNYTDIIDFRNSILQFLVDRFDECNIDSSVAIKLREPVYSHFIDVIPALWFFPFKENSTACFSPVKLYNQKLNKIIGPDFTFKNIQRINKKDKRSMGGLKRMIRLLKNIKLDSSDKRIHLSSFDINAICYSIPIDFYINKNDLELIEIIADTLKNLCHDKTYETLLSPAGDEFIFLNKDDKIKALKDMAVEIQNSYLPFIDNKIDII